jgi:hypothetical protein
MESNHPSVGLPRPAGFEDRLAAEADIAHLRRVLLHLGLCTMVRAMVGYLVLGCHGLENR